MQKFFIQKSKYISILTFFIIATGGPAGAAPSVISVARPASMTGFPEPIKSATVNGYVKLKDGVKRYYEYHSPLDGKPTLVFINGLIWPLPRWKSMIDELNGRGYGTLIYDMRGQSKTLLQEQRDFLQPLFPYTGLSYQVQAEELLNLLNALSLREPVVLIPLSYGAAAGTEFYRRFPERISEMILLAPLVQSSDHYDEQGKRLNEQLNQAKQALGPVMGPVYYDMLYRMTFRAFIEERIVPEKVPDEMKPIEYVYKESLYQLIRGVRDFHLLKNFPFIKGPKVSLFLAEKETPAMLAEQKQFFSLLPEGSRGIAILVKDVKHAIPDERGVLVAQTIDLMLNKDPRLVDGSGYELTVGGEVRPTDQNHGSTQIR